MNKKLKKIFVMLMTFIVTISSFNLEVFAEENDTSQIIHQGVTTTNGDGVEVQKIITATDKENYFDIELKVKTETEIKTITVNPDVAVAIVIDTSGSMGNCVGRGTKKTTSNSIEYCSGGDSRLDQTKAAVNAFIDKYYDLDENNLGSIKREIGIVRFSGWTEKDIAGASVVQELKNYTEINKSNLKNSVNNLNAIGGTNLQQGIKLGNEMLDKATATNKYLIILTDGYPTLYGSYNSGDGWDSDDNLEHIASYAKQAENEAGKYDTFLVSVGLDGQRTWKKNSNFSSTIREVFTPKVTGYFNNKEYSIGPNEVKVWLEEDIVHGKGKFIEVEDLQGVDSTGKSKLESAFIEIFNNIEQQISIYKQAWTVDDPMGTLTKELGSISKYIEFVGFYDKNNNLTDKIENTGANLRDNYPNRNTASFNRENNTISWDLKKSNYENYYHDTNNNKTYYYYSIKYKVRLENELEGFIPNDEYNTNNETILHYAFLNEEGDITELNEVAFDVPKVTGYLGKFEFYKISSYDNTALKGVTFKLQLDPSCECLEEKYHINSGYYLTATSDENGKVVFDNIPSGHKYKLVETSTVENYKLDETEYDIEVNYGITTVDDRIKKNKITVNNIRYDAIYNDIDYGFLTIKKVLDDTYINNNLSFKFNLETNSRKSSIKYTLYNADGSISESGKKSIVNGIISFELMTNQQIKFELPAGSRYRIVEYENEAYNTTYDNNVSGIISPKANKDTIVINKTKPIIIKVDKKWENVESFSSLPGITIKLYRRYNGGEWEAVPNGEVVLSDNNKWHHEWELAGEYEYKVEEISNLEFFIKRAEYNEENHTWTITNINTLSVVLPDTGSSSMLLIIIIGLTLITIPMIYSCNSYISTISQLLVQNIFIKEGKKKMKKILTFIIAAICSFALITGVKAAGNGTITINGTTSGKDYGLYRIFNATISESGDTTKVAYTINSAWENFFKAGAAGAGFIVENSEANSGLSLITVNGEAKRINITQSNMQEFATKAQEYAKNLTASTAVKVVNATGTTTVVNNLDLGYYLVFPYGATEVNPSTTTNPLGTIVSLTTTKPSATVNVKATYPTIDKTVDDTDKSVTVGQVLTYTIEGTVPNTTGYTTYTYKVSDEMSAGLTFGGKSSITVKIGDTEYTFAENSNTVVVNEKTILTYTAKTNGFELSFNMPELNAEERIGEKIEITYTATVNSNAINHVETNKAVLEYTRNPKGETTTTPEEIVEVYTSSITVYKYDGAAETATNKAPLAGAKFVLKNNNNKYYSYANGKVTWVTDIKDATELTTGTDGKIEFVGLDDGKYFIVETEAPEGYNKLTTTPEVNVLGSKNISSSTSETDLREVVATFTTPVANYSGTEIPSTGGMGTKLFIIIGSIVAISTALIMVTNKRISREEI